MTHDSSRVVRELCERYPLLASTAFTASDSGTAGGNLPFLGVLLSTIQQRENGACCIVLPNRERIPFALAVLTALTTIKTEFAEPNHPIPPLQPGQMVRVSPSGFVFEFVGYETVLGRRWIRVRNLRDDQIWHMLPEEAFRLTPTDSDSPSARKGEGPGPWEGAPIDQILGTRTGGNLATIPNRVILVTSRSGAEQLATSTKLVRSARRSGGALIADVLTWGRIRDDGRLVSEDWRVGSGQPIIAATHSINNMALACRSTEAGSKVIIVDGAALLTRNVQALDDVIRKHRLLILADHDQLEDARVLRDRGCEVWTPDPGSTLIGIRSSCYSGGGWFASFVRSARNALNHSLEGYATNDPVIEEVASSLDRAEAAARHATWGDEVERLIGGAYRLLIRLTEWFGDPGVAARQSIFGQVRDLERVFERSAPWLVADFREEFATVVDLFRRVAQGENLIGEGKLSSLIGLLRDDRSSTTIVVRSAPAAARLRNILQDYGIQVDVHHLGSALMDWYDRIVFGCWPGRRPAARIINQHLAHEILLVGYPFEIEWMTSFRCWRERELSQFHRSTEEVRNLTGVQAWHEPKIDPPELPPTRTPKNNQQDQDPLTRFLGSRRKGSIVKPVPEDELREAWYVGFHGPGYAFLTETHKVPVLTDLVLEGGVSRGRIPLRPVRKLQSGDFLLFRDHGDRDVIALIAEHELGSSQYERLRDIAGRWRGALRSIGEEPREVLRRLREQGLERNLLTIRIWLTDDSMIGPGSRRDLEIISRVSGDEYLQEHLDEVEAAIRAVRGAHVRAGSTLSQLLLAELPEKLPEVDEAGTRINFGFGSGYVVCVEEIGPQPEHRPYWEVNRLLFDGL